MDTPHKLHTWIILLLLWNSALLVVVIGLLWMNPTSKGQPDSDDLAQACGTATLTALKDSCLNL